jgi:hypothetical protein
MHTLQPVLDRLTLGFSVFGFTAIAYGNLLGEQYPGLVMELGFASILAAWMSWAMSGVINRLARIEIPVQRRRTRD